MSVTFKTRTIVFIAIGVLLCTFFGGWLLGRYQRDNISQSFINTQTGMLRRYTYQLDSVQKIAAEKDAVIMTQKQAIEQGLIIKEELKKINIKRLNEITHLKTTVDILLDSINYIGGIVPPNTPCPPDEDHPVLYLPLTFGEDNNHLHLKGVFDEDGKLSMEIQVPISLDMFVGYDKTTKTIKSVVSTDNPYVKLDDIFTLRTDLTRPQKWGIGIIGGYGIAVGNPVRVAPFIGVGLSRSFIRF